MSDFLSMLLGIGQGFFNLFSQNSTNRTNLQIARETNQANAEQAHLSYMRSLPANQVSNLMSAGMSKPAALASLSGGGSYSAPVMQAGHVDAPQLDMTAALERLQNMPTNVEQRKLIQAQRNDLETSTRLKENQDKRAAELHEYQIWREMYGKNSTQMLDSATNTILNALLDSGKDVSSFKSFEDMIRGLGLQDNKIIRGLPSLSHSQVYSIVRDRFTESREQREQQNRDKEQDNRNLSAKDAHIKLLDDLKNSEFARTLSSKQISKIEAETERAWQDVDAFHDATDARQKENAARAARADFERLMTAFGLAKSDWNRSNFYYIDKNGNIQLTEQGAQKKAFAEAWQFAGSFFGVDLLKDIISGLVAISPK